MLTRGQMTPRLASLLCHSTCLESVRKTWRSLIPAGAQAAYQQRRRRTLLALVPLVAPQRRCAQAPPLHGKRSSLQPCGLLSDARHQVPGLQNWCAGCRCRAHGHHGERWWQSSRRCQRRSLLDDVSKLPAQWNRRRWRPTHDSRRLRNVLSKHLFNDALECPVGWRRAHRRRSGHVRWRWMCASLVCHRWSHHPACHRWSHHPCGCRPASRVARGSEPLLIVKKLLVPTPAQPLCGAGGTSVGLDNLPPSRIMLAGGILSAPRRCGAHLRQLASACRTCRWR